MTTSPNVITPGIKAAATIRGIAPEQYLAYRQAGLKWCPTCQKWQPTTDFKASTTRRDGVAPTCTRHLTGPQPISHGITRYRKGCRCQVCRSANTKVNRKARARRKANPETADRAGHGKVNTYNNYCCRCEPCSKAHAARMRTYQARNKAEQA
ncbi:hypothetical protein ACFW81_24000 [Streptomyces angustmyceticus]|uniref:hypothetical protein n=1 Tax=Streptomyces angustmyceticus TaxID=285578 RepID=UPI0036D1B02C